MESAKKPVAPNPRPSERDDVQDEIVSIVQTAPLVTSTRESTQLLEYFETETICFVFTSMSRIQISWKRTATLFFSFSAIVCALFIVVFPVHKPPKEKKLIDNFNLHRAAYERLRNMLAEDKNLIRLASWGVETRESVVPRVPPDGDFPVDRYQEYLALLKQTGGTGVFRGSETLCTGVWASGFAGDTRHVEICWIENSPPNQVSSLDDYYQTPKPRRPVFRRIDGRWYLWADW